MSHRTSACAHVGAEPSLAPFHFMSAAGRSLACVLSLVLGCHSSSQGAHAASERSAASAQRFVAPTKGESASVRGLPAPRIVFAIVLDQLGSDTLARHFEWLDPQGAIRTAAARGAYLE